MGPDRPHFILISSAVLSFSKVILKRILHYAVNCSANVIIDRSVDSEVIVLLEGVLSEAGNIGIFADFNAGILELLNIAGRIFIKLLCELFGSFGQSFDYELLILFRNHVPVLRAGDKHEGSAEVAGEAEVGADFVEGGGIKRIKSSFAAIDSAGLEE